MQQTNAVTDTRPAAVPTNQWILLARHLIGVTVLLLAQPFAADYLQRWIAAVLFVMLASSVLAGLWWVFFTERSRGHVLTNFINLAWVLALLVLLGLWRESEYARLAIIVGFVLCAVFGLAHIVERRQLAKKAP